MDKIPVIRNKRPKWENGKPDKKIQRASLAQQMAWDLLHSSIANLSNLVILEMILIVTTRSYIYVTNLTLVTFTGGETRDAIKTSYMHRIVPPNTDLSGPTYQKCQL